MFLILLWSAHLKELDHSEQTPSVSFYSDWTNISSVAVDWTPVSGLCIPSSGCHSEWSLLNCPNCLIRLGRMRCDSCRVIHVYEFPAAMMACRWVQGVMRPLAGELASVVHVMGNWREALQSLPAPRQRYTSIFVSFSLSISLSQTHYFNHIWLTTVRCACFYLIFIWFLCCLNSVKVLSQSLLVSLFSISVHCPTVYWLPYFLPH